MPAKLPQVDTGMSDQRIAAPQPQQAPPWPRWRGLRASLTIEAIQSITVDPDTDASSEGAPEWLVTNGLGGYSSGTVSGLVTRRFHGYLVAALPAPRGRTMMLNPARYSIWDPSRSGGWSITPRGTRSSTHLSCSR